MENIKSYNFSTIRLSDLQKIVSIKQITENAATKFGEWFDFEYVFQTAELSFLEQMIKKYQIRLKFYLEETLKIKFIGNLLNYVDFVSDTLQDWYDAKIWGVVNGVELEGFVDMVVAKGLEEAEKPYFFIQEFKPSKPDRDPEAQLLAEMLVAIEKNQTAKFHGGYIIGRNWYFVILEKIGENNFEYFVSKQLDSLDFEDLKQIYICLQAVKLKYCVD